MKHSTLDTAPHRYTFIYADMFAFNFIDASRFLHVYITVTQTTWADLVIFAVHMHKAKHQFIHTSCFMYIVSHAIDKLD